MEAESAFAKHLDENTFWSTYRDCLRVTTRAIVEVDWRQRSLGFDRRWLESYARVSAIFKVAPAAVCVKCRGMKDFPRVARFHDQMTIVGQILDDLEDMEEDLQRDQYNFAASTILRSQPYRQGKRDALEVIAERIIFGGVVSEFFREMRLRLGRAARAIAPVELSEADDCIARWSESLEELENAVHMARVKLLLPSI